MVVSGAASGQMGGGHGMGDHEARLPRAAPQQVARARRIRVGGTSLGRGPASVHLAQPARVDGHPRRGRGLPRVGRRCERAGAQHSAQLRAWPRPRDRPTITPSPHSAPLPSRPHPRTRSPGPSPRPAPPGRPQSQTASPAAAARTRVDRARTLPRLGRWAWRCGGWVVGWLVGWLGAWGERDDADVTISHGKARKYTHPPPPTDWTRCDGLGRPPAAPRTRPRLRASQQGCGPLCGGGSSSSRAQQENEDKEAVVSVGCVRELHNPTTHRQQAAATRSDRKQNSGCFGIPYLDGRTLSKYRPSTKYAAALAKRLTRIPTISSPAASEDSPP